MLTPWHDGRGEAAFGDRWQDIRAAVVTYITTHPHNTRCPYHNIHQPEDICGPCFDSIVCPSITHLNCGWCFIYAMPRKLCGHVHSITLTASWPNYLTLPKELM